MACRRLVTVVVVGARVVLSVSVNGDVVLMTVLQAKSVGIEGHDGSDLSIKLF